MCVCVSQCYVCVCMDVFICMSIQSVYCTVYAHVPIHLYITDSAHNTVSVYVLRGVPLYTQHACMYAPVYTDMYLLSVLKTT